MGEFEVENLVLERNYGRATIHHFHIRVYSVGFILAENFFKYSPKFYLANLISNRKVDIDISRELFIWVFYGYASFYLFQVNIALLYINR